MEIGGYDQVFEVLKILIGDAATSEFAKMLTLFTVAAWLHSTRVRREIRTQLSALTEVLREDLAHQKTVIAEVRSDVDTIKNHLKIN